MLAFFAMQDERRFRRRILARKGEIRFDGADGPTVISCLVRDLSAAGAQLLVSSVSEIPPEFKLKAEGMVSENCLVKWRAPGRLGVEFVSL